MVGLALTRDVSRVTGGGRAKWYGVLFDCYSEGVENWIEQSGCDRTGH